MSSQLRCNICEEIQLSIHVVKFSHQQCQKYTDHAPMQMQIANMQMQIADLRGMLDNVLQTQKVSDPPPPHHLPIKNTSPGRFN